MENPYNALKNYTTEEEQQQFNNLKPKYVLAKNPEVYKIYHHIIKTENGNDRWVSGTLEYIYTQKNKKNIYRIQTGDDSFYRYKLYDYIENSLDQINKENGQQQVEDNAKQYEDDAYLDLRERSNEHDKQFDTELKTYERVEKPEKNKTYYYITESDYGKKFDMGELINKYNVGGEYIGYTEYEIKTGNNVFSVSSLYQKKPVNTAKGGKSTRRKQRKARRKSYRRKSYRRKR